MANHVFFKDLLFLMVGAVMLRTHADTISELGGVGRKMPVTMFCFFIGVAGRRGGAADQRLHLQVDHLSGAHGGRRTAPCADLAHRAA